MGLCMQDNDAAIDDCMATLYAILAELRRRSNA